jgi:hypothetical protein
MHFCARVDLQMDASLRLEIALRDNSDVEMTQQKRLVFFR